MPEVYAGARCRRERSTSAPSSRNTLSGLCFALRREDSVSQPMSVPHVLLSSVLPPNSSAKTRVHPCSSQRECPAGSGGAGGLGIVQPPGWQPAFPALQPLRLLAPPRGSQSRLLRGQPSWHWPHGTSSQEAQSATGRSRAAAGDGSAELLTSAPLALPAAALASATISGITAISGTTTGRASAAQAPPELS